MLVEVIIESIKKKIVIPETWIYDINEEKLKNYGVNRNQKVLIYWSTSAIDANGCPIDTHQPNFLAPACGQFPPADDEACYIAYVNRYFGMFKISIQNNTIVKNCDTAQNVCNNSTKRTEHAALGLSG